ncbi:MAG: hypothetical protein Q8L87_00275, partial [Anaerolineales bacterium]|nr:hypothetical protein [Anaerolineales bacterium]
MPPEGHRDDVLHGAGKGAQRKTFSLFNSSCHHVKKSKTLATNSANRRGFFSQIRENLCNPRQKEIFLAQLN